MESIIKHYQVAHVGFSLSYPDSCREVMAVLLEAYHDRFVSWYETKYFMP